MIKRIKIKIVYKQHSDAEILPSLALHGPQTVAAQDLVSDNAAMSAFGYGLRWPMVLLQLPD